jgi:hypothetical protein
MIADTRPLVEITQEALEVLYRELGMVATIRFLNQFTSGFGNYTEERSKLLENQSLEDAISAVRSFQSLRPADSRDLELPAADLYTL